MAWRHPNLNQSITDQLLIEIERVVLHSYEIFHTISRNSSYLLGVVFFIQKDNNYVRNKITVFTYTLHVVLSQENALLLIPDDRVSGYSYKF